MEWPPEFILARLRQLARDKLQPSELLTILRELALQYKASWRTTHGDETTNPRKRGGALTLAPTTFTVMISATPDCGRRHGHRGLAAEPWPWKV
jgi:hypothetical protein